MRGAAALLAVSTLAVGTSCGPLGGGSLSPGDPECTNRSSVILDYTADAKGEGADPVRVARAYLEDRGLRAGDVVERAPSAGRDSPVVRVVRDADVVARVALIRAPAGGGWLVSQVDACSSFDR